MDGLDYRKILKKLWLNGPIHLDVVSKKKKTLLTLYVNKGFLLDAFSAVFIMGKS